MIGSGYKTFTAGAVLTASDVQNYLQDQSVMVFGGTAARSSAIGTANFEEGMLTYLTDVDKLQVYTGATFADVYPPATSNQGLTLINTTAFSGVASQSINDVFSATYDNYKIIFAGTYPAGVGTGIELRMRVSGADNTSANYDFSIYRANFTNTESFFGAQNQTSFPQLTNMTTTTGFSIDATMFNPFLARNTDLYASANSETPGRVLTNGTHKVASSFTGFTFYTSSGSNITGKVSVYGFNL